MRSLFFLLSFGVMSCMLIGCDKETACTPKTVASEVATMQNFATTNGLSVQTHSSGMLYQIVNPGSGLTPTLTSRVSVRYTGKLMNGTIFDSNTGVPIQFLLGQVIPGWQLGLPLIKKVGVIRLIIPSSLAYGCNAAGSIPGDSVLYFEVELVDVL